MNSKKIMTISGVQCYELDGVAYLHLETVARRLGFTQKKGGVEYVRWETVGGWMERFGFPIELGKTDYIPENIFYRLAMKAKNETAEQFQALVADEIIPAIRRTGSYSVKGASVSPADYMKAAQIVSRCPDKRLQIVLSLLEAGGIHVDVPEERPKTQALPLPAGRASGAGIYGISTTRDALVALWDCPLPLKEIADISGIPLEALRKYWYAKELPPKKHISLMINTMRGAMENAEVGA